MSGKKPGLTRASVSKATAHGRNIIILFRPQKEPRYTSFLLTIIQDIFLLKRFCFTAAARIG